MIRNQIHVVYFDLGDTVITRNRIWVPGAKAALATLGAANIRLGVLSNTADLTRQQVVEQLLPDDFSFSHFEERLVVLSSEVHTVKPDAQIFGLAVDRAALPPSEILFCGEKLLETLSAQMAGMLAARVSVDVDANGTVVMSDIKRLADQIVDLNEL